MQTSIVFGKEWFIKHQPKLLWLLNHSSYFRSDLGISLPKSEKITQITPNSFSYGDRHFMQDGKLMLERTTDFRTHDKFGKRLYYGFYPVWNLAHQFDMHFANNLCPAFNVGFDTLTAYPAAGANSPVDGTVAYQGTTENFATVQGAANGTSANVTGTQINLIIFRDNSWSIQRVIILFDTSGLTASATISSTILSIYGRVKVDANNQLPNIDIYTSTPTSNDNLVNSDYSQIGTTSQTGSPITFSNFSTSGYNDFTFNSTGISNVSKTGISKFGARNQNYDVSNTAPSINFLDSLTLSMWSADQTGTNNDPKLVVTYTLPSTFVPKITIF